MRTIAALCRELLPDRRSDGELLRAFLADPSEDAFAELIRRHGPLVWGVCRRLLPNPADAEDAFQAAFIVLVRRAPRLTHAPTLGAWLHRVAVWTARNVRRKNARRLARQHELPEAIPDQSRHTDPDLKADLDDALLALPARYRESIILCHLQGYTRREAAERLGCPEGTLSAWLNRGLAKLRDRLRGLDPAKALGVASAATLTAVPGTLSASTLHAAVATTVAAASLPVPVSSLVEGVLHMFWVKKATAATVALFATFALGVGIGVSTRTDFAGVSAGEDTGLVRPSPDGKAKAEVPVGQDREKEIARLEKKLEVAQGELKAAERLVVLQRQRLAVAEAANDPAKAAGVEFDETSAKQAKADLEEARKRADEAAAKAEQLEKRLAELRVAKAQPAPKHETLTPEQADQAKLLVAELEEAIRDHRLATEFFENARKRLALAVKENATPEEILVTRGVVNELRARVAAAAEKVEFLRATLEAVKAGKVQPAPARPKTEPTTLELQDEAKRLAQELELLIAQRQQVEESLAKAEQRIKLLKEVNAEPKEVQTAAAKVEVLRETLVSLTEKIRQVKQRLDDLKATKLQPQDKPAGPPAVTDLDEKLRALKEQLAKLQAERNKLVEQRKRDTETSIGLERQLVEVQEAVKAIEMKRAELAKQSNPAAKGGGYVELRVRRVSGDFMPLVFSVTETDANGREVGTLATRHAEALQKLLTRIKNDPTAPKELRVVVEPGNELAGLTTTALKACDAAGYKTVKFTGYVFGGGLALELKPDEKGEVPGYTHYREAEKRPADLIKEIGEGMRRY